MSLNRRDFSVAVAGLATLGAAHAQGAPVEGKDYQKLSPPVPVTSAGKVEVVEFFWYGCPHCNALEPYLNQWLAKLPPDVSFRRIHVGFTPVHAYHLKLFYALEAMGVEAQYHSKVFAAIHVAHQRLGQDSEVLSWASSVGLDGAKLVSFMNSFSVAGKLPQARQLTAAYHVDGVPTLGVQGRYTTSPAMVGSETRVFNVLDALIATARKQG
ncbi:MAG TPA: thiol:disulfide interchange protein DsbA/DsbL [Ideonella sp.]|uniref:thiol:disulfide interchange protein DsbA/DsbL n=1 Tax=Ideonella sp. TaxID=1929293 RepID=UPI002B86F8F5|nr:thiol:disulfide interchange protein DsbA/DsbL [Ideonella sp.]HSI47719.1 thiol:disulfide interchange protein DsbA/DsbL [Ideonella sp.]